jgi:hypothetical protein
LDWFQVGSRQSEWERNLIVEDFPIWLKIVVWLIIGGSVAYAIGAAIYSGMMG